ncbi:thioredoxin family protein [Prochlorothrix hollandica]|uniref:thioredoxin family protein n=1 Tax=Prochlorothrix hollandica TaxID=1223 RepID=UPI000347AE3C|nr:thioredoxin family protein [Prochlorothrix hollandica]
MAVESPPPPDPNPIVPPAPLPQDTKTRNLLVAVVAIVLSVVLFFSLRTQTQTPSLGTLAAESTPLEVALANGQPTLMEFYADWCTSCQTMAPLIGDLEQDYGDRLNVVMLNVDNDKWLPEVLNYRVDGIPHFVFLDAQGQTVGQTIGEQPRSIMVANLDALLAQKVLPYAATTGRTSLFEGVFRPNSPSTTDPRSHSSQSVVAPS